MPRGKSNIEAALKELSKTDVYSLILFALWKLKEKPEYSTLSELAYILDNRSLLNFLNYYGGSTIQVPTKEEFKEVIEALLLYQRVNLDGLEYKEAIKELGEGANTKKTKATYEMILELLKEYDFKRN